MTVATLDIIQVMEDPALFGPWFQNPSWNNWKTVLKGAFALPFDSLAEEATYMRLTGRHVLPLEEFKEIWCVCGRRGGKSVIEAAVASYISAFKDHSEVLSRGETGTYVLVAQDRRSARTLLRYVKSFFEIPLLRGLVRRELMDGLQLEVNGCDIVIEVMSGTYRAVRGYSLIGCCLDELSFWKSETSQNPDVEVIRALRPGLSTTHGPMWCVSSPYARRGALFQAYQKHFGKDASTNVLVMKAASLDMNPTLNEDVVTDALEDDEQAARSEWLAEFRADLESYVSLDTLLANTITGRLELPCIGNNVSYYGFCDPAGGSGSDSMTLCIAHTEKGKHVMDKLVEVHPPFNPDTVTAEFATVLKRYRLSTVTSDRYAGSWPATRFEANGISLQPSEKTKSEIYINGLPLLTGGLCELVDSQKLRGQLLGLERRTARAGKDSVDHGPGGHDDVANAAMGALLLASSATTNLGGIF